MDAKKQPSRGEVIENGSYIGFIERGNGKTEQRWELNGIVFSELCDQYGTRRVWQCLGKKSRVAKYGL